MDLRVDDTAMRSLVAKAVVDSLTPEAREGLIKDAVAQTLTVPVKKDAYSSDRRSPLQCAFDSAVAQEARSFAAEIVANDVQFKAQLHILFADVAARLFETTRRESMVEALADTIEKALTKDRY